MYRKPAVVWVQRAVLRSWNVFFFWFQAQLGSNRRIAMDGQSLRVPVVVFGGMKGRKTPVG
jgi:hypothetical protein